MARKKWPRMPSVEVPLFGGRVYLALTREQYLDAATYLTDGEPDLCHLAGATGEYEHTSGERVYLVGVFDGKLRTLAHELAHVTFRVLDRVGVETNAGARETFCYLQDFLFSEFEDRVKEAA